MRRTLWSCIGVLVCACAAATVATGFTTSAGKAKVRVAPAVAAHASDNKILRLGTNSQFQNPNPFNVFAVIDYNVMMLEFPYLVQYDTKGNVVPDFATKWSHTANGKTWTFTVRANAKWSDGQPMTAADVAWTMNTIIKYQNGGAAVLRENVSNMTSASAPNPTTVLLHYKAPTASVLSFMNNTEILPQHIWASHTGGKNGADLKAFKVKFPAVGGGPFIPASWNGTTFLLLKRNPNYYGPKPGVDEVGIQYFTTPDSLLQALKQKKIDYANAIPQSSASVVRGYGLVVNEYPSLQYLSLYINAAPKAPHQELLNPLVRQAIDVAIDRAQIVKIAYPGSQVGESVVTPATGRWWNPAVKPTYSAAKANQLLDQAGFTKGSDGIRVANGKKMSYTIITDTGLGGAVDRTFQIIQANLKAVGIEVTQKPLDPNAWLAADYGTNNTYDTLDMAIETNAALLDPGYNLIYFACTDYGSYNWSGFCDKSYDALYYKQAAILNDAAREKVVHQAQVAAQKKVAAAILLYSQTVDAHQKGWVGFGADPVGAFNYLTKLTFISIHHT